MKAKKTLFVLAAFTYAYTPSMAFSFNEAAPSRIEAPAARQGTTKPLSAPSAGLEGEGSMAERKEFTASDTWTDPDAVGFSFDDLDEPFAPYNEEVPE